MYRYLRSIDLLGPQPKLYINKNTRYKTIFGGALTILIGFLSVLCFFGFGIDIIQRKKPATTYNKNFIESPTLESNETFFAIGVFKMYGFPIKNVSQKLKLVFDFDDTDSVHRRGNTTIVTRVDMVPCLSTEKFKNNFLNVQSQLVTEIDMYMCPPDDFKHTLEGKFGNSIFKIFDVFIMKCDNSSSTENCAPDDEIKADLNEFFVHFLYLDHYVNSMNYTEPVKPLIKGDILQLSISTSRYDSYFFDVVEFYSDDGWILQDLTYQNSFQYASSSGIMYPLTPQYIHMITISLSNIKDSYTREYIKLQAILANTGGFIKFIMMFLSFINEIILKNHQSEFILLQLYNKYLKYHNERVSENQTIPSHVLNSEGQKINTQVIKKNERPLVIKPINKWILIFGRRKYNKNLELVKKFETRLKKQLEIKQIFKKFEQLKLFMKFVLKMDYENSNFLFYQKFIENLFDGRKNVNEISSDQEKTKIQNDKSNFRLNNYIRRSIN